MFSLRTDYWHTRNDFKSAVSLLFEMACQLRKSAVSLLFELACQLRKSAVSLLFEMACQLQFLPFILNILVPSVP